MATLRRVPALASSSVHHEEVATRPWADRTALAVAAVGVLAGVFSPLLAMPALWVSVGLACGRRCATSFRVTLAVAVVFATLVVLGYGANVGLVSGGGNDDVNNIPPPT